MHLFNAIILLAVIVASSTDAFFLAKNNIKKIVMFGDSVSDVGRAFNLTKNNGPPIPGNAFWQGRFSDGPVWIEVLAKDRKVALDSYACGGATTSDKLLRGFLGGKFSEPLRRDGSTIFVPGIDTQINEYLAKKESVPKDNILYAIWAGGNDRFNDELAGFNRSGSFYAKAQYEQWVQLAAAGAKNIVSVVPPPQTGFDIAYGLELQFQAAKFQVKNLDIKFGLFQLPLTFIKITLAPFFYGLKYGTNEKCCFDCYSGVKPEGNATVCADPEKYIIYDGIHPSAASHRVIAKDAGDFIDAWWGFANS